MTSCPLDFVQDWWYPKTDKSEVIPRNIKLAHELTEDPFTPLRPNFEFLFYDKVEDKLLVVETHEILNLLEITTCELEDGLYIPTVITIEEWVALKPQLIYLGVL